MTNEEVKIIKMVFQSYLNIVKIFKKPNYISEEVITEVRDKLFNELEQTRWIPVSERLPEEDEWVLITFDNGIEIALLDDDGWCYSSVGNDDWIAEHPPVAWMPLPEPYKAENKTKQGLAYADQDTLMSAT